MLSGKLTRHSQFAADDLSGVDYNTSLDAVTCAIPGGKRPEQAAENCAASDLPPLSDAAMQTVRRIYDERIRAAVHPRW
jgi:hypothetical protein